MNPKTYGYVRVSTQDQNLDRQLIAMKEFGVPPGRIYQDKMSGKDFNRPAYRRLLKRIRAGDTIVIMSIDRLGRNYEEILEQWRIITKEKSTAIVVLDMPLLSCKREDDLTARFLADMMLYLLSYVAQTERDFIRKRQAEGIAAARARGTHLGRRPKTKPNNYELVLAQWKGGGLSARNAALQLGVNHKTFLKWAREAC